MDGDGDGDVDMAVLLVDGWAHPQAPSVARATQVVCLRMDVVVMETKN
jgi:hypothetical protein